MGTENTAAPSGRQASDKPDTEDNENPRARSALTYPHARESIASERPCCHVAAPSRQKPVGSKPSHTPAAQPRRGRARWCKRGGDPALALRFGCRAALAFSRSGFRARGELRPNIGQIISRRRCPRREICRTTSRRRRPCRRWCIRRVPQRQLWPAGRVIEAIASSSTACPASIQNGEVGGRGPSKSARRQGEGPLPRGAASPLTLENMASEGEP